MKNKLLYVLGVILMMSLFSGCSKVSDEELRAARKAYENGALIIDVRTREEFNEKHAKGAVNIAVQNLERYYEHIPKGKEIIVYCRTGSRSHMAAEFLKKKGRKVYDVATQDDWERELSPSSTN
jgi:phage shock protein E